MADAETSEEEKKRSDYFGNAVDAVELVATVASSVARARVVPAVAASGAVAGMSTESSAEAVAAAGEATEAAGGVLSGIVEGVGGVIDAISGVADIFG